MKHFIVPRNVSQTGLFDSNRWYNKSILKWTINYYLLFITLLVSYWNSIETRSYSIINHTNHVRWHILLRIWYFNPGRFSNLNLLLLDCRFCVFSKFSTSGLLGSINHYYFLVCRILCLYFELVHITGLQKCFLLLYQNCLYKLHFGEYSKFIK